MRQQVQLWYKICVHRFLFLTTPGAAQGESPRKVRFHRCRAPVWRFDVLPREQRGASFSVIQREVVAMTERRHALLFVYTLFVIVVIIPVSTSRSKKNKSKTRYLPNSSRVSCWNSSLTFRTLNFAPKSLLILPAKRAGSALWYFLCMFIYFVYPFRFATLNKKKLWCNQVFKVNKKWESFVKTWTFPTLRVWQLHDQGGSTQKGKHLSSAGLELKTMEKQKFSIARIVVQIDFLFDTNTLVRVWRLSCKTIIVEILNKQSNST